VVTNDQANAANAEGAGDGEVPLNPGTGPLQGSGPSELPTSPPRGADINAQLAQERELEAKLAEEYHKVRLPGTTITGKPPRAVNACVSWASRPMLTVHSCIKVRLDLQVDKSPVVVKGPFFPRVVKLRYRIRGTNV
jgi:hypothetical protein